MPATPPSLTLRPLCGAECAEAGAVVAQNELWNTQYRYPADQAARDIAEAVGRGDFVLGAFGDRLLGFAWVIPRGAFGRSPYLRLLAVAKAAQGAGVGAALLSAAEDHCRAAGARQLLLLVSDFNEAAQRFYRAQGYAQAGSLADFVQDGIAEQLWMKRLA